MKMTASVQRQIIQPGSLHRHSHPTSRSKNIRIGALTAIFSLFVAFSGAFAQSWTNAIDLGSPSNEYGQAVCTDAAGNTYFTGRFLNTVNFNPGGTAVNLTAVGSSDIYVTKYNAAGVFQWAVSAGGAGTDFGAGITTDGTNVYLIGGFANTATFGTNSITSNGGQDIYVAQLSASTGTFNWVVGYGGAGDDNGWAICLDGSGNPYITGNYYNTAAFGTTVLTVNGGATSNTNDIYVASLNPANGSTNWAVGGGAASANDANASSGIAYNAFMNTLVVATGIGSLPGQSATFGTTVLTTVGNGDACVLELNPTTGAFNHAVNFGTAGSGTATCFADCYDANSLDVFVAGTYNSNPSAAVSMTLPGTATLPSTANDAMFTARYSVTNHAFVWAQAGTVSGTDNINTAGFSIAADNVGGIYTSGYFANTLTVGTHSITSAGLANIFVAKFTAAKGTPGYLLLGSSNNTIFNNQGFGVSCATSGALAATGSFATTCIFGTDTLTSAGLQDIYLAFGTVPVYTAPSVTINASYTACASGGVSSLPYSATTGSPTGYSVYWNAAGYAAGLTDLINSALPTGSFTIAVPSGLVGGPYTGYFMANDDTASQNVQTFTVTFMAGPVFTSATNIGSVCSNTPFTYTATTSTSGVTFSWSRAAITGITNAAASDTGAVISESLNNNSSDSITVIYVDSLSIPGCTVTQDVTVTVYPEPVISNTTTTVGICTGDAFSLTQTSAIAGATITWGSNGGGSNPASSGTGNIPSVTLVDSTLTPLTIIYTDTIRANGCTNTENISVIVNPIPTLSSSLNPSGVCSGNTLIYTATSYESGVLFAWSRAVDSSIVPASGAGSSPIIEDTLTNSTDSTIDVVYAISLDLNGCTDTQYVTVPVGPYPTAPVMGTMPPATLCEGTNYMNFGAATTAPSGSIYTWSAVNATVYRQAGQYALVSFPNSGNAMVILTSSIAGGGCAVSDTFNATISSAVAPSIYVIDYNNSLICLPYTMDSYQWGYDDGVTLDSTAIPGANNQDLSFDNPDPSNFYWVIATSGDCIQKAYYNTPAGVTNVGNGETVIKVYPNPSHDVVAVSIKGAADHILLQDVTGKTLQSMPVTGNKVEMNVTDVVPGYYLISCYHNGVKMVSTQFIKD